MVCIKGKQEIRRFWLVTFSKRLLSIIVHSLLLLLPGADNADDDQKKKHAPNPKHCSNYGSTVIVAATVTAIVTSTSTATVTSIATIF